MWNLYPLRTILEFITGFDYVTGSSHGMLENAALANLLGNVAIFVPLGVYVALFRKNGSLWKTTLTAAATSLAFELVQVATRTGSGDVDDVLLNALGGLLGALLYRGDLPHLRRDRQGPNSSNTAGALGRDCVLCGAESYRPVPIKKKERAPFLK